MCVNTGGILKCSRERSMGEKAVFDSWKAEMIFGQIETDRMKDQ